MVSGFPPTSSSNYEDLLVEYLEVYVSKDQEQAKDKLLINGCLKCESATSDSDSGRGSCDSHTLLMDKCGQTGRERAGGESHKDWEEGPLAYADVEMVSPDVSSGRVKTWPSVFSPVPQYSSNLLEQQQHSLELARQHYLSDSLFPPSSHPSYLSQPGSGSKEAQLPPSYWEFNSSGRQPHLLHPHTQACRQLQAHSDVDIASVGRYEATVGTLPPPAAQEEELITLGKKMGCSPGMPQGDDYSKVKGVDKGNVLLLQRERTEDSHSQWMEEGRAKDSCCVSSAAAKKPAASIHSSAVAKGEAFVVADGYVDTAALPSY